MIPRLSVKELADRLAAGKTPVLLDVRQPWEHTLAALAGSTLIPLNELPHRLAELEPHRGSPVIVYCHHGVRSLSGAAILLEAGFADVRSLDGGIDEWSRRVDPSVPTY